MPDGSAAAESKPKAPAPWDRILVCVVSGQAWVLDLVQAAADPAEHEIRTMSRDADALERVTRLAPAVVVVDISGGDPMPFDLLRSLQASPLTSSVPSLAIAASDDPLVRAAAFSAGVEDFVTRGIEPEELRARLRTLAKLGGATRRALDADAAIARLQTRVRERDRDLGEMRQIVQHMRSSLEADNALQRGRVERMVQLGLELNKLQDFHVLMERILSEARALLRADAGTIFLRESRALRFAYAQNDTLSRREPDQAKFNAYQLPVTETSIAGWVAMSGEAVNLADAYDIDASLPYRFDPSFDRLTGYATRSILALPLRTSMGSTLGVLQLLNALDERGRPRDRFSEADQVLLGHFASMATVAIERSRLAESIISRMLRMAESRDPSETAPHAERVAGVAALIFEAWAHRRGLSGAAYERQRDRLVVAARLHDVGKVGISDTILSKPGPLTPEELVHVRQHVIIGARFFMDHPTEFDEAARDVVLNHHERWDGTGYPGHVDLLGRPLQDPRNGMPRTGGKRGEEIPLFARIVGLADVYDALQSTRAYKQPWAEKPVLNHIRGESGRHFDPELVEIFFAMLDRLRDLRAAHPD
ncbi:MAG: HD domain-containing phosphohydrolase [Phycisphaerales bacterium]